MSITLVVDDSLLLFIRALSKIYVCIYWQQKKVSAEAEFDQPNSGHGDSEMAEAAEKPLLEFGEQCDVVVKQENDECEPPESRVDGDTTSNQQPGSDVLNENY